MNQSVQLIRLTLLDGDPEGLRAVSVAGRTTVLTGCPWGRLQTLLSRPEAQRPAVYFMVGNPLQADPLFEEVVYIGECDSLADRFKSHHKHDAADWTQIFVATTTESTFNKAHARRAEHLMVDRARSAGRAKVLTTATSPGDIDEGDAAFISEFVANFFILAQTLGVLLFRPKLKVSVSTHDVSMPSKASPSNQEEPSLSIYNFDYIKRKPVPATMATDGRDFVILKGSKARPDGRGIPDKIRKARAQARASGLLTKLPGDTLETFQEDYSTTSASFAGGMVYGSSCNGPKAWLHTITGKSYGDWVAKGSSVPSTMTTP